LPLVHFWLPAFATGALVYRLLKRFFATVKWMQWFIKRGKQHPFEAVGMTAAGLAFVAATLIDIARSL